MNLITLERTADILRSANNLLFICHTRPDGDTIGSANALMLGMRVLGKRAYCTCDDVIPKRLQFLCGGVDSLALDTLPPDFEPKLKVAVDVATPSLLGSYEERFSSSLELRIDHHENGELDANEVCLDGSASAVGELAAELLFMLGVSDVAALTCAYAAICSDSGCFKYSSVTSKTHELAASLIASGVNHAAVNSALFGSRPLSQVKAYCVAVEHLRFVGDGVAVISFPNSLITEGGFTEDDIGDLASIPRGIEGVELGITIKPMKNEDGRFKMSMRSGESIDCSQLCELFNGGGHKRASAAVVDAPNIEAAEAMICERVLASLAAGIGVEICDKSAEEKL